MHGSWTGPGFTNASPLNGDNPAIILSKPANSGGVLTVLTAQRYKHPNQFSEDQAFRVCVRPPAKAATENANDPMGICVVVSPLNSKCPDCPL